MVQLNLHDLTIFIATMSACLIHNSIQIGTVVKPLFANFGLEVRLSLNRRTDTHPHELNVLRQFTYLVCMCVSSVPN